MVQKIVLFTLLSAFTLVVSTPDLIALIDKDVAVNILLDSTDEEKKESETSKEKEVKIIDLADFSSLQAYVLQRKQGSLDEKKYTSVYLNLTSPPPEFS